MCTVTLLKRDDNIIVTMSRDEHLLRLESGLKTIKNEHQLAFPQDKLSGGTWMGVNEHGTIMCLLNRYQDSRKADSKTETVSRGKIIPEALSLLSNEDILKYLQTLKLFQYEPFDLVIVSQKSAYLFSWNGCRSRLRDLSSENSFMITSSSISLEDVISYRRGQFENWLAKIDSSNAHSKTVFLNDLAESILNEFHLAQQPDNKSWSVLMSRLETEHQTHTKSITQAILKKSNLEKESLQKSQLKMDYYDQKNLNLLKQDNKIHRLNRESILFDILEEKSNPS